MLDNFTNETTIAPATVTALIDNATVLNDDCLDAVTVNNLTNGTDAARINDGIKYVGYISVPLFCIMGLFGNSLTVIIMSSKHFRSSTTFVHLSALAISDTLYIVTSPFTKHFINELIGLDVRALSRSGCKAFFCFFRSAKICSSWFVVVICIERFLVIWFPLQAKFISTKTSAIVTVTAVTVAIFTFDGFWSMVDDIVNGVCIPNVAKPETKDISAAFVVAGTTIFNIIPTIILLVFTPLTIFKLYRQKSIRLSMNVTRGNQEVIHITKTLLCVMIAYIILVTPISVAHSVAFFSGDSIFESKDPDFIYFREFAQMLESLNYSINFLLYVVSNETFRKRLFKLLSCETRRQDSATPPDYGTDSSSRTPVSTSTIVN